MYNHPLIKLAADVGSGQRRAITSICSAHSLVLEAALLDGLSKDEPVLIEATCNQVNQDGGYTGMVPRAFRSFVETIASRAGFPSERLMLGGDHLGPNPWKLLGADEAMSRAEALVDAYTRAGFSKLHLDTSMACHDDAAGLAEEVIASRAARLAAVAEAAWREARLPAPVYVIGTEVPVPGGALEALPEVEATNSDDAVRTVELHRAAFEAAGIPDAFSRCVGIVVQPGVEFGNENVVIYNPSAAAALPNVLARIPGFVFEAHSTDYQPVQALADLVRDGFAILKVGPGLTFALRETLYGLDSIAVELGRLALEDRVKQAMERVMLEKPTHWIKYYPGTPDRQYLQRHFSYSDRIRYYWPDPKACVAVDRLLSLLEGRPIPETLISQYLKAVYPLVLAGRVEPTAQSLLIAGIQSALKGYNDAGRDARMRSI